MNKRKAKAIAYHCFASITEEIVANMDWSEYDERDKELIIKCIDDHGYGQPKSKDLRRYHVEVFGVDGIHDVNDTKDFPTIEDAMETAFRAACQIVKERETL